MIEFHADDFGLFERQSRRILQCYENGILNGVSVMPNSDCLPQCVQMLKPYLADISVAIHLNLVEGRCLADPNDVFLLVDEQGVFNISFGKLLFVSFLPVRKKYIDQIGKELIAQIQRVGGLLEQKALRLDSHVHYHMLPVVFDALMEVIKEDNLLVEYIRIPREHISDYAVAGALSGLRPINIIKAIILNILAWRNQRKHRELLNSMEQKDFYGVVHSGNMCYEIVQKLIKNYKKCDRTALNLEILFHPGSVLEKEDQAKITNTDDLYFLTNAGRKTEADAMIRLKEKKII